MFMKNDIKKTQHPNSIKCLIFIGTIASVSPYNNWGEASEFNATA